MKGSTQVQNFFWRSAEDHSWVNKTCQVSPRWHSRREIHIPNSALKDNSGSKTPRPSSSISLLQYLQATFPLVLSRHIHLWHIFLIADSVTESGGIKRATWRPREAIRREKQKERARSVKNFLHIIEVANSIFLRIPGHIAPAGARPAELRGTQR